MEETHTGEYVGRWEVAEVPEALGRAGLGAGAVTGHGNRAVVPSSSPTWREGLGSQRPQGPSRGPCALEEQGQGL